MSRALIGHTGFVGSNLLNQQSFDDCFNSKNINEIEHKSFEQVICAGVSAVKWMANREPVIDRKNIQKLVKHLKTIKTNKFILISTVDVYPNPIDVNENSEINIQECHPYGKHRLELENIISNEFDSLIVRLPGLFGLGLKKNIIYDFLNQNNMEQINPNSIFQFYYLKHLTKDIEIALNNNLNKLNISSEPTTVQEIAQVCLGHELESNLEPGITYDYKSSYAELFGGKNGYLYSKEQVLTDLKDFTTQETRGV